MSPSPERPGQNPNVLQSSSLEPNKGSGTFARTTYPPETLPKTPAPDGIPTERADGTRLTQEDRERIAREVKAQERKTLITRAVLVLSTLAATGLAVKHDVNNFTDEHLFGPRIVEDITSIPQEGWNMAAPAVEDIARLLGKKETVPPIFDTKADKQVVKAGVNAVPATREQIQNIVNSSLPTVEKNATSANIVMILPKHLSQGEQTNILNIRRNFKATPEEPENLVIGRSVVYNKGEEVPIPVVESTKQVEVFRNKPYIIDNKSYFTGLTLKYYGPGQNLYVVVISTSDARALSPSDVVKDAPILNRGIDVVTEKGLLLPVEQLVNAIKVNLNNTELSFLPRVYPDSSSNSVYTTINFGTDTSGQILSSPR